MVLTEIERGPALLEALAECREIAEEVAFWERKAAGPREHGTTMTALMNAQILATILNRALLDLGNLMVGR